MNTSVSSITLVGVGDWIKGTMEAFPVVGEFLRGLPSEVVALGLIVIAGFIMIRISTGRKRKRNPPPNGGDANG